MATGKGKPGRPSDYTPELADRICEEIANSDTSLRQICARTGMPNDRTVRRWLVEHEEFARRYARARESQGDVVFDGTRALEKKAVARKLPSDIARVVILSMQWRAAKLAPKKYGERLELKHAGGLTLTKHELTDADLEAIAAGRSPGAAGKTPGEGES